MRSLTRSIGADGWMDGVGWLPSDSVEILSGKL